MTTTDGSASREYENGVADVISYLLAGRAAVTRDARLPGRHSGRNRQIDVLVRGDVWDGPDTTIVVECKRWGSTLDVGDLDGFIGKLDDVAVKFGMLIASSTISNAARRRGEAGGARARVLTLAELASWRPIGTFHATFEIPVATEGRAAQVLRHAGYRVARSTGGLEVANNQVLMETFRHYGTPDPAVDVQHRHLEECAALLADAGIDARLRVHGCVRGGGTPRHKWVEVLRGGQAIGMRVLADSREVALSQLPGVANAVGVPVAELTFEEAEAWSQSAQQFNFPPLPGSS